MAEASDAKAVVEELPTRQREMYAGGDLEAVRELHAEDVVWHVLTGDALCVRGVVIGSFQAWV